MGGVIYLSLVVRRVAIRFRLSYYSQDEPGYSTVAFPGESCEPAMPLLRAHRWIPWLKSGLRHQGTKTPYACAAAASFSEQAAETISWPTNSLVDLRITVIKDKLEEA